MRPLEGTADAPVQGHSTNVRLVRSPDLGQRIGIASAANGCFDEAAARHCLTQ